LGKTLPFRAVIGLAESALLPAARLSEALGLRATPVPVVEAICDKSLMRRRLDGTPFGRVAATRVTSTAEIDRFGRQHGYPLILKPANGLGSRGVVKLDCADDIGRLDGAAVDALIETFIDGREFSIESFSFDGVHRIIGINEETKIGDAAPNPFVEIAHEMPAQITETTRDRLISYVCGFLDAIGLANGPSHTEVKLGSDGFQVIETHNRIGGDGLADMVRQTTGLDLLTMTLQWQMREMEPLAQHPVALRGAAVRYFTPAPGVVKRVHGVKRWGGEPGVVRIELPLKPGDRIVPVRDWQDRPGHVMATGDTAAAAAALCRTVAAGVVIETDAGQG
jgi:biotin carboxylase